MLLHDASCGRADSLVSRIAAALKIDCPCCSIWRGVVLGAVIAGLAGVALGAGPRALAGGLSIVVGVFALDLLVALWRSLPASTGD